MNSYKAQSLKAQSLFESLKDNPQEIIDWAYAEIAEYEKLIKILESEEF